MSEKLKKRFTVQVSVDFEIEAKDTEEALLIVKAYLKEIRFLSKPDFDLTDLNIYLYLKELSHD